MTDGLFCSQEGMEETFAVLVNRCGWACLVQFEALFENLVGSLSHKLLYLSQLLLFLLDQPVLLIEETWLESFVALVTRPCLSLLDSLLSLVILALLKSLPINSVVVLLWPYVFPLFYFFNRQ